MSEEYPSYKQRRRIESLAMSLIAHKEPAAGPETTNLSPHEMGERLDELERAVYDARESIQTSRTPADELTDELGDAFGRKAQIMEIEETMDEMGMTNLERYELALSILERLNYEALKPWSRESSRESE